MEDFRFSFSFSLVVTDVSLCKQFGARATQAEEQLASKVSSFVQRASSVFTMSRLQQDAMITELERRNASLSTQVMDAVQSTSRLMDTLKVKEEQAASASQASRVSIEEE